MNKIETIESSDFDVIKDNYLDVIKDISSHYVYLLFRGISREKKHQIMPTIKCIGMTN